jgi:hypothetical protein
MTASYLWRLRHAGIGAGERREWEAEIEAARPAAGDETYGHPEQRADFKLEHYPAGAPLFTIGGTMTRRQPVKAKKRPKKRGPKEERLIISEDPEIALAKLLRPTTKKAR